MLGRRAAIGTSIAVLAVVGGGGAIAATHGSTHTGTKPKVHKVVRQSVVVKNAHARSSQVRSGHHCSHSGDNISSAL